MTADQYLQGILAREAVDMSVTSPVRSVRQTLLPILQHWGGAALRSVEPSGSFAKGTANRSGTDIDLFVSLHSSTTSTLKEIHDTLYAALQQGGYSPRRQNVSLNVKVNGYDVDVVPAKRQDSQTEDHSLYRRRADSWTKTNVQTHIAHVRQYGRQQECRVLKLWRDQKGLDFPSFYIELSAITALATAGPLSFSARVWTILQYLNGPFENARVIDPANTNNIISDDLNQAEKRRIQVAASAALNAKTWGEIVR